jgi:hypothetical protein
MRPAPAQRTGLGDPSGRRALRHPGFPLLGGDGGLRWRAPLLPHVGGLLAELPSVGGDDGATAGPRSCSSLSTPTPSLSLLPWLSSLSFPLLARSTNDDVRWGRREA